MVTKKNTPLPRAAGLILHPISLPSKYGIGDLGPAAYSFIDYLVSAGVSFWQMLPMGPTGYADSPYQNISAFAGNTLVISPEGLVQMKLVTQAKLDEIWKESAPQVDSDMNKVNFDPVHDYKEKLFEVAYQTFEKLPETHKMKKDLANFCTLNSSWLDEFALFFSIKKANQLKAWWEWKSEFISRDPATLSAWQKDQARDIQLIKFLQWIFDVQWSKMKEYAHEKGIQIIGDMPIFVAHDSSDVWAHREYFTLKDDGKLEYQAGVPPDYFSATGQLWGNPLYRWDVLKKENYRWFVLRLSRWISLVDWMRVDHFRGFEAYWRIPGTDKNAINGQWIKAPGKELFLAVRKALGKIPIIAEDLGIITPEVEDLRDSFEFPGMKVLHFAFSWDPTNPHLPQNVVHNSIIYTGTHDNDTTVGWWGKSPQRDKEFFVKYTGIKAPIIPEDLIKMAYASVANLAVIPMQDLLQQGTEFRMNTPSVPQGNWQYRIHMDALDPEKARWLRDLISTYRRLPAASK